MFEDRLARLLYKLTVETDMGISAVLDCIQLNADYLRKLRTNSAKNVKATNGLLTFEQKVNELESSVDGDDRRHSQSVKPKAVTAVRSISPAGFTGTARC